MPCAWKQRLNLVSYWHGIQIVENIGLMRFGHLYVAEERRLPA